MMKKMISPEELARRTMYIEDGKIANQEESRKKGILFDQPLMDVPLPENREVTLHVSNLPPSMSREVGKCSWINTKGRNVGKECGKGAYDGREWCAAHITVDLMNKKKNKPPVQIVEPEPEISEDDEEYEEIRAPSPTPLLLPIQAQVNDKEERILNLIEGIMTILTQIRLR